MSDKKHVAGCCELQSTVNECSKKGVKMLKEEILFQVYPISGAQQRLHFSDKCALVQTSDRAAARRSRKGKEKRRGTSSLVPYHLHVSHQTPLSAEVGDSPAAAGERDDDESRSVGLIYIFANCIN